MMLRSVYCPLAVAAIVCITACPVLAQVGGGATGTGTGGTTGIGEPSMSPDIAFEAVERSTTIGATGATGTGFSELSVASGSVGAGAAAGGLGGFGGFGGGGGLGALGSLFGGFNAGGQTTKPVIRTRLRSAIAGPPTPPAIVQQTATMRFRSLPTRPALRGINVTMQGRTAVITGVVSTSRDRRMSEMLMRLEPGVSNVDNQVQIQQ